VRENTGRKNRACVREKNRSCVREKNKEKKQNLREGEKTE